MDVNVDIERQDSGLTQIHVTARESTLDFDREYARSVLSAILEELRARASQLGAWRAFAASLAPCIPHTHPKVMAWLALDRMIEPNTRWAWASMPARCKGRRTRSASGPCARLRRAVDAADLRLPRRPRPAAGRHGRSDPRSLARDDLVYRYLGDDGLLSGEGAFVICSFWMVQVLARIGRVNEATRWFEKLLERPNDLGLLSEEIDPDTATSSATCPRASARSA